MSSDHEMMVRWAVREMGERVSETTWTRMPGTHFRASRCQFVRVLEGATTRVGVRSAAFWEIELRHTIVFPVPGALAIRARNPYFPRVSMSSRWKGLRACVGLVALDFLRAG